MKTVVKLLVASALIIFVAVNFGELVLGCAKDQAADSKKSELQSYFDEYAAEVCLFGKKYLAYYTKWNNNRDKRLIPLNELCTTITEDGQILWKER